MSHNNGIAAKGTFKVVPQPKFPPHAFFSADREFPLRIRHASATFLDDAMNCIRSISLKLADTQFESPFDLQMNSGETSLFWSAASFWKFAELRKEKYGVEYREYNQRYPEGLESSKIATRRHIPFDRLYYYCKTPFQYNSSDGKKYFAKYRIIPFDRADDAGIRTDRSDWDQCNQRVENQETQGRNSLKYAYADLVAKQGFVRYWLQIQTRPVSDAETDPELCNNMVVWNEPWQDVGVMEVTETLDWRESTLTSFSVNNMPKGLGVIPATSIYDYNSLNYLRSHAEIAYKARIWSYTFFGMVPPIPDNDNRNVSEWGE
jgi:catalase